jgi:hypothetical protein
VIQVKNVMGHRPKSKSPNPPLIVSNLSFAAAGLIGSCQRQYVLGIIAFVTSIVSVAYWIDEVPGWEF